MKQEKTVHLSGYLKEFRDALQSEISAIEKNGQNTTVLFGGHIIERKGTDTWYQFRTQSCPNIPSDTPCKLRIGKDEYTVTIVSVEDTMIIISSTQKLPETIATAQLENGSTILMELLIKRIEEKADIKNDAGIRMLETRELPNDELFQCIDFNELSCKNSTTYHKLTNQQKKAVKSAVSNNITYIWGPPGTGKTSVIASIIIELFHRGRSVLLVSHTNTAVDGAIKKVNKEYLKEEPHNSEQQYPILRLGNPAIDSGIPNYLLIKAQKDHLGEELEEQKKNLDDQMKQKQNEVFEIESKIQEIQWLESNRINELKNLLSQKKDIKQYVYNCSQHLAKAHDELLNKREEFSSFNTLKDKKLSIQDLQKRGNDLEKQILTLKEKRNEDASKLKNYRDAIAEQEKYKELESHIIPFELQEEKINKTRLEIKEKETERDRLKKEKDKQVLQIAEYKNAGFIGKLGKKKQYEQACTRFSEIEDLLDRAELDLVQQNEKYKMLQKELKDSRKLKEHIQAIDLSSSIPYWRKKQSELESVLEKYDQELSEISFQYREANTQAELLIKEIEQIERQCTPLFLAQKEYDDYLEEYRKAKEQLSILTNKLEDAYYIELNECKSFVAIEKPSVEEGVAELNKRRILLMKKYASISVDSIKRNEEQLKNEIIEIQKQISEIEKQLEMLEKQIIQDSKIIGTTLAKSYLNDSIQGRQFDTVILDEASMAPIPALWCASSLASKNIIIVGDFLQLAPIVVSDNGIANKWLGKDIFEQSGMIKRLNENNFPDNFVVLNEQFRMEQDIAEIANNLYYGNYGKACRLKTNTSSDERKTEQEAFFKWYYGDKYEEKLKHKPKHNIHLIDTESLHAWVTGVQRGKGSSRFNAFSAALDVNLAFTVAKERIEERQSNKGESGVGAPAVLIVVPYKPHAELIQRMIDLEYSNRGIENLNLIQVGTVHSFQGKEADIVIFDLVVDEPHWSNNLFLPDIQAGDKNDRMFNVAITRAKFQLFIVGNFKYCRSKTKSNANSLWRFLSYLMDTCHLPLKDAKEVIPKLNYIYDDNSIAIEKLNAEHLLCLSDSFDGYFKKDLERAQTRILIYSPFITENRVSILLPYFAQAKLRHVQIIIFTKAYDELPAKVIGQKRKCESILSEHGVRIIHRKGMHEKIIFIDDSILWCGSLNVLSFSGSSSEFMNRFYRTPNTKKEMSLLESFEKAYDIDQILTVANDEEQTICPICHSELLLCDGSKGGYYWQCVNKDYSRNATQPYPKDGILRCLKCGGLLKYKRKNEPRWECKENPDHHQKVKLGDLKLPKMRALVQPESEIAAIEDYLSKKVKSS